MVRGLDGLGSEEVGGPGRDVRGRGREAGSGRGVVREAWFRKGRGPEGVWFSWDVIQRRGLVGAWY